MSLALRQFLVLGTWNSEREGPSSDKGDRESHARSMPNEISKLRGENAVRAAVISQVTRASLIEGVE